MKSSRYGRLFKILLFIFSLPRNEPVRNKWFSYTLGTYETYLCKVRFNRHLTIAICSSIYRAKQGFTLVELMITVALLAIIVTFAAPSVQAKLASMEALRIKNQVETSIAIAKAESYIRKENVLVCLSNDGRRCRRDDDKMLLVFIDRSDTKNYDAQLDSLITQQTLNPKYSKLSLRVGNRRHYTKFWGDSGTPRGHFGHIKYCPTVAYNKAMYLISFNQSGIVKQKLDENHPTQCNE